MQCVEVELSFLQCSLVSLWHNICMNYKDGIWDGIHIQLKRIIKYYCLIHFTHAYRVPPGLAGTRSRSCYTRTRWRGASHKQKPTCRNVPLVPPSISQDEDECRTGPRGALTSLFRVVVAQCACLSLHSPGSVAYLQVSVTAVNGPVTSYLLIISFSIVCYDMTFKSLCK